MVAGCRSRILAVLSPTLILALTFAALAAGLAAPGAQAASVALLDASGSGESAYGGWAAWTHSMPGASEYELMLRAPDGTISPAPVPVSKGVFEVRLGPAARGVEAVY